jgi:hypothetical protein
MARRVPYEWDNGEGAAMWTFSVIKAATGGFVGDSAVHQRMLEIFDRWEPIAAPTPA